MPGTLLQLPAILMNCINNASASGLLAMQLQHLPLHTWVAALSSSSLCWMSAALADSAAASMRA
jgi:hypothetical protein